MKIFNIIVPLVLFVIGVGCQSHEPRTASSTTTVTTRKVTQTTTSQPAEPVAAVQPEPAPESVQEVVTDKATYTIEVIPNTRLTPTSREGDQAGHVYSSNIIAVHVHPNSGVTVDSTNNPVVPAPENSPKP